MTAGGILLVDKPGGITSHDVVARARRALGTRKVGHAGTLDPMATGLLVVGVDAATRLLTYVVGLGKTYEGTIRLGQATTTDDADGEQTAQTDASSLTASQIEAALQPLRGVISQVPSTFSAIKVEGRRAYDLARAGEEVHLKAREVTVSRLDVVAERRHGVVVDLDVVVDCSSGTYIRALARDLGSALGVGGHLTALRRTRIGPFSVSDAVHLDDIGRDRLRTSAAAAAEVLGRFDVTGEEARDLRHGKRLSGAAERLPSSPIAAVDPDGVLVGIVERRGADVKSVMNMPEGDSA
ncbi:tRNA pseudouridine(55) synthase TruB [Microbacterium aurantiacum]|uniref:tRNA pseudouridine synthase B n=1 Tax=Microbacterium aurantiacum TaxID=162393 RepID=A0A0N0RRH9_9MICO|nr:tRNA pseudouridine(55) synthase TruB [Microbacterium chocolatum]ANG85378.1 tRNA pseudouridine(55) synthase TruB [Microbacterium chocolatum]KOS11003.1 tRNA pseudouridine synthase B [Microbacterium chocolatum]